ncbi:MAG: TetR/AcrR family transcriptional regulator [Filifactoraceae bacterium]
MPRKGYSREERETIYKYLLDVGRELFGSQGYRNTTLQQIYEKANISKTFFYSFFPTKDIFVARVLESQQPLMLKMAEKIMCMNEITWEERLKKLFHTCLFHKQNGIVTVTIEESIAMHRNLEKNPKILESLKKNQLTMFDDFLELCEIDKQKIDKKVMKNLFMGMLQLHNSMEESMPFFSEDAVDETAYAYAEALILYMKTCRKTL